MNVKELQELLNKYPPDMRVIVEGYEDGYDDISIVREQAIIPNANEEYYYGAHAEAEDGQEGEKALLLAGENLLAK
jgi:hypothetical protein